jgi:hypothetical protein
MTGTGDQSDNFNSELEVNLFLKSLTTEQSEKITTACYINTAKFGKFIS